MLHLTCHKDVNYKTQPPLKGSTIHSSGTQVHLLWIYTQLQTHIRLFHFKESWYRMMYISVSGYKSCCQSQLLLSVYVLWKWNGYLSRSSLLTLIVHTVTQLWSHPFTNCKAHFMYTDSNNRRPVGTASIVGIYQGHTASWLHAFTCCTT